MKDCLKFIFNNILMLLDFDEEQNQFYIYVFSLPGRYLKQTKIILHFYIISVFIYNSG